jgi:hypothetical protein
MRKSKVPLALLLTDIQLSFVSDSDQPHIGRFDGMSLKGKAHTPVIRRFGREERRHFLYPDNEIEIVGWKEEGQNRPR